MADETASLVERLRAHAALRTVMQGDNGNTAMLRDAANEIDRLRGEMRKIARHPIAPTPDRMEAIINGQ